MLRSRCYFRRTGGMDKIRSSYLLDYWPFPKTLWHLVSRRRNLLSGRRTMPSGAVMACWSDRPTIRMQIRGARVYICTRWARGHSRARMRFYPSGSRVFRYFSAWPIDRTPDFPRVFDLKVRRLLCLFRIENLSDAITLRICSNNRWHIWMLMKKLNVTKLYNIPFINSLLFLIRKNRWYKARWNQVPSVDPYKYARLTFARICTRDDKSVT